MRTRLGRIALGLAAVAVTFAGASTASAQSVFEDSVTGTATLHEGGPTVRFDAHSGPTGESPRGTVALLDQAGNVDAAASVYCLTVKGNRAAIAVVTGTFPPQQSLAFVEDTDGAGLDRLGSATASVDGCPLDPPAGTSLAPIASGDLQVVDAQPPTVYAQCRQGGWVKYSYASHADCINYVHQQARQKCIFERLAHGITAFRAKYGLGPDRDHAMRHCVRLYTGF